MSIPPPDALSPSAPPRVALSQDFLLTLSGLHSTAHARVVKWALKFQQNPIAPEIGYAPVPAAGDGGFRAIRVDGECTAIVFRPEQGDLCILLHVGPHEDACRWAERRRMAINPVTGALHLLRLDALDHAGAGDRAPDAASDREEGGALFAALPDDALIQLGTPVELLPLVRRIRSERELDEMRAQLPVEAYEGLFLVAGGESVSRILGDRETRVDRARDTNDFVAALDTVESQSRFVVVTSDAEMTAILNAPLAQWRVFLHPIQRRLAVGDRSGPVRILGGAGTGKTVLAMHRAKWLAKHRTPDGQKVLFITFTRNLALDIEQNMKSLFLDDADLAKVEICNLDRWVHRFLRQRSYEHRIIYKRDDEAWGRALQLASPAARLDEAFHAEEWDRVIAPQGIRSLDDYRRASRVGRRTLLSRAQRDAAWPVFEEYRAQLTAKRLKDVDDAYRDAAQLLVQENAAAARPQSSSAIYSAIVVDEAQDFGQQALRLMRAMVPVGANDLFLVGDGHQRIYTRHKAVLSRCGIDIRGRSRKLYLNYRTTEEIRSFAVALLEGREVDDLDGGSDDNRRYKSLSNGPAPEVLFAPNAEESVRIAVERIETWLAGAKNAPVPGVCVMTPTARLRDDVAHALDRRGIASVVIEADGIDSPESTAVRVSTMHRAKGLEFDRVVVIAHGGGAAEDPSRLIYVSLTRAKSVAVLIR